MSSGVRRKKPVVLAILTTSDDSDRSFRGNHSNFIDIIRSSSEFGAHVYVVTTVDLLQAQQEQVEAFEYDFQRKDWIRRTIPLPQVIYNRIPTREEEQLPQSKQAIALCLAHPKMRLYNPAFFNKWHLFEWLRKSKTTRKFAPETLKLNARTEVRHILDKHSLLYLKPEKGKAGKGIMRIRYSTRDQAPYHLTIQNNRKSRTHKFEEIQGLKSKLDEYIDEENYIIQQGIRLATFRQRPFDLRVLVQKNGRGQWTVTGVGARVAGSESITTHVPRGGSIDDPIKLLQASFGRTVGARLLGRIKRSSLSICRQLERASGQRLGEMSLDLGVDTKGKIWFFEANSKPMKFDEPDIRKKSLQRLFDYSRFLARKPNAALKKKSR